jgi:hypothetical protein
MENFRFADIFGNSEVILRWKFHGTTSIFKKMKSWEISESGIEITW